LVVPEGGYSLIAKDNQAAMLKTNKVVALVKDKENCTTVIEWNKGSELVKILKKY
jgi:hypothetical protein